MPTNTKQQLCIKPTGFLVWITIWIILCLNYWTEVGGMALASVRRVPLTGFGFLPANYCKYILFAFFSM